MLETKFPKWNETTSIEEADRETRKRLDKEDRMIEKYQHSPSDGGEGVKYERLYGDDGHMDYMNETMPMVDAQTDDPRYCAGCGGRIVDRYFLKTADNHWHVHCLQCYDCKYHLDNEPTCFVREGNVYCKEDYYRRFSIKCCAKCRLGIAANEMVMRAKDFVFHMNCFSCCACAKALLPGDYFGMRDGLVYCRDDYEAIIQGQTLQSLSPGVLGSVPDDIPFYTGTKRVQKGRPRKRKIPPPEGTGYTQRAMGYIPGDGETPPELLGQDGYMSGGQSRQKRVRTSFKHHQLRAMKSYFALNHNPDAKDLKQLAQKTGLSKRVLQVWFQNARAKYRRHVLKSDDTKPNLQENAEGELPLSDDEKIDDKSFGEISNNSSSSLSDLSSTQSLSDIQSGMIDYEQGGTSLPDLFTSTLNTIN